MIFGIVFYAIICVAASCLHFYFLPSVRSLTGIYLYYLPKEEGDTGGNAAAKPGGGKGGGNGEEAQTSKASLKHRKKDKGEWDASGAKLNRSELIPRIIFSCEYYKEFEEIFLFGLIGLVILLSCELLHLLAPEQIREMVYRGDAIALLFSTIFIWKLARGLAKVQRDKRSTRTADLQISLIVGLGCFLAALLLLFVLPSRALDFDFKAATENAGQVMTAYLKARAASVDGPLSDPAAAAAGTAAAAAGAAGAADAGAAGAGAAAAGAAASAAEGAYAPVISAAAKKEFEPVVISLGLVRVVAALLAGYLGFLLAPPVLRFTRSYFLATHYVDWDVGMIRCGLPARLLLHLNFLLPIVVLLLWIPPMTDVFVYKQSSSAGLLFSPSSSSLSSNSTSSSPPPSCPAAHPFSSSQPSAQLGAGPAAAGAAGAAGVGAGAGGTGAGAGAAAGASAAGGGAGASSLPPGEAASGGTAARPEGTSGSMQGKQEPNPEPEPKQCVLAEEEEGEEHPDWAFARGVSPSTFGAVRLAIMALSGLLQIASMRANVQAYLNTALVLWYEHLHGPREAHFQVLTYRMVVTNHFLCKVALQLLVPGALQLFLLGVARTRGPELDAMALQGACFIPPLLVRQLAMFCAWWCCSFWALGSCFTLLMFRLGYFQPA